MRAPFCIKANYYRFLSKLPHFERVHVVFEPDGVSFYRVYFRGVARGGPRVPVTPPFVSFF